MRKKEKRKEEDKEKERRKIKEKKRKVKLIRDGKVERKKNKKQKEEKGKESKKDAVVRQKGSGSETNPLPPAGSELEIFGANTRAKRSGWFCACLGEQPSRGAGGN